MFCLVGFFLNNLFRKVVLFVYFWVFIFKYFIWNKVYKEEFIYFLLSFLEFIFIFKIIKNRK